MVLIHIVWFVDLVIWLETLIEDVNIGNHDNLVINLNHIFMSFVDLLVCDLGLGNFYLDLVIWLETLIEDAHNGYSPFAPC